MSQPQKFFLSGTVLLLMIGQPIRADEPVVPRLALPSGALTRLGTSRFLNFGRVFSVAFSPDGKTVAGGAWDGTIRTWEVASGKELHLFHELQGPAHALAFSPDGKLLACGGKNGDLVLRATATGNEVQRLKGHSKLIMAIAFSPDGKLLASKAADQAVRLWNVAEAREVRQFRSQDKSTQGFDLDSPIAFLRDGKAIVAATLNVRPPNVAAQRIFRVWDVESGAELLSIQVDSPWNSPIAISPKLLAVGVEYVQGGSPHINLWDLDSGKALPPIQVGRKQTMLVLTFLAFSPDGKLLASSGDGPIHLWEIATRKEAAQYTTPDNGAVCLAFSPMGRVLASGSTDTTTLLWDLTGHLKHEVLPPLNLSSNECEALWGDLGGPDPTKARRALWTLVAGGETSVAFLQTRLHPVASPASDEAIANLVANLSSPEYPVRAKASTELVKLAELAEPALAKAQKNQPALEQRRRIDDLMKLILDFQAKPSGDRLRGWRSVEILEQIGTPEARQLLQTLSRGAAGAVLTRESAASVVRLDRKANPTH